jgi:biotin transport system ATP-binding protein
LKDRASPEGASPEGGTPLFEVRNLSKVFPAPSFREEGYRALWGINLRIYRGECLFVAGSNGSGKTILTRILTGLMAPSGGEIFFQGESLGKAAEKLRTSVGLVFQDAEAQIIGETVEEDAAFGPKNLGFPKAEVARRVSAALAAMGLSGKEAQLPRRLSGGEKRRLAVAGVLAMGCETVIMDEPFANLDWPGVVQALEIIRDLKSAGKTLVILTHELEKALAFADRLVILHRGMIREDGEPEPVLDRLKPEYGVRDPRRGYASVRDCTWLAG